MDIPLLCATVLNPWPIDMDIQLLCNQDILEPKFVYPHFAVHDIFSAKLRSYVHHDKFRTNFTVHYNLVSANFCFSPLYFNS